MIIDLNSFDREKVIDEMIESDAIKLELDNARVVGKVAVNGTVSKASASVELVGRLSGMVEIACDRCLDPVERPIDIALDLEFAPKEQLAREANLELHSADMKLDAIDSSEIDLAAIAREQILLDLPQQFFCKESCRGLCEKCGTNLNLKDCDCEDDEVDPRWAALKNLN